MKKTMNWLWDVRKNEDEAKVFIQDPDNPRFLNYVTRLLSRNNDLGYVFSILDKQHFCEYWPLIQDRINKTGWFSPYKSDFWQPVYEKTLKELKKNGIHIHEFPNISAPKYKFDLARQIRKARIERGLSQKELAEYLRVTQQYISRVETGRVNMSIDAIYAIANFLLKGIEIRFS